MLKIKDNVDLKELEKFGFKKVDKLAYGYYFKNFSHGFRIAICRSIHEHINREIFLDTYKDLYDVKAGKWPTNYNECILVLSSKGNVSDFLLYTLGLREYSELESLVTQFSNGENVDSPDNLGSYSYNDILGITFKLINSSDCYEYDEEYKVWRDKTDNTEYMKSVVENGEDLKIVGIVQPKEGATSAMLSTGICYPESLTNHIIENAKNSKIVQEQLENPEVNVFTGKRFDDTKKKK